jgi:hypothetical protein
MVPLDVVRERGRRMGQETTQMCTNLLIMWVKTCYLVANNFTEKEMLQKERIRGRPC